MTLQRDDVLLIIDGACWEARQYGPSNKPLPGSLEFHPSAEAATDWIMGRLN